jgi:undecaprenyl-diphosphatase
VQPDTSKWRILLTYLLPGLFASALVLSALAEFHEEISDPWLIHFDQWAMQIVHQHMSPGMTHLMLALMFIGSVKVYLPLVLLLGLYLWRALQKRQALVLLIGVLGAGILKTLLKLHFRRLRPDVPWALIHEHNFSFPSGHATAAFALYGMLAYLIWLATLIGADLHVHHPARPDAQCSRCH